MRLRQPLGSAAPHAETLAARPRSVLFGLRVIALATALLQAGIRSLLAGWSPARRVVPRLTLMFLSVAASAQQRDLLELSIEDLMNIKITSAARKEQKLAESAAAIYVLTADDIRRGGFTTLPEALRMAPGMYVARANSHGWQISTRGFSDLNNNKMLVLVDGRSVYSPLYGGVYWDALDIPLEDIERIEVIRGPGGTLWGANAVNGVINIVTKSSARTQGVMVSTSADLAEGYSSTVQYGGQVGHRLTYRVFGRASYWEPFKSPSGATLPNLFALPQAGARVDWTPSQQDTVTLETGAYDGRFQGGRIFSPERTTYLLKDSNVALDWKHTASDRSSTELLAYCDWYTRQGVPAEMRNTFDIELQHTYQLSQNHSLIWGGGIFSTGDDVRDDPAPYLPLRRRNTVLSVFAQYEWAIVPDRLRVFAGSKLEHNGYTGVEYQPQVRAVWTPAKGHVFWSSISRAVRIPARNNTDINLVVPQGVADGKPVFLDVMGNPDLQSEHLRAYELGYRYQPKSPFSLNLALYYNDYAQLIESRPTQTQVLPDMIVLRAPYSNAGAAQTHGAELSANWRPVSRWTLSTAITGTRGSFIAMQNSPRHLFNVQSRIELPYGIEFNSALYHYGTVSETVPRFGRVDLGISWRANSRWTLSVWGRNPQSGTHRETGDLIFGGTAGEVPRSLAFKLVWQSTPRKDGSQ